MYCKNGSGVLVGSSVAVGLGKGLFVAVIAIGWKGVNVIVGAGGAVAMGNGTSFDAGEQATRMSEIRIIQRFIEIFIREIIMGKEYLVLLKT